MTPMIFRYTRFSLGLLALLFSVLMAPEALAKEYFKLSTLGPGTTVNAVMTTFANLVNTRAPDYEIQVNATGAGTRHVLDGARGKIDFFLVSPVLYEMFKGQKAMYKKVKNAPQLAENMRTIFNFPMGVYHIVVYEDSGIRSLKDIKGKRVFLGPPAGAAVRTTSLLLKAVTAYQAGEDFEQVKLSWSAASQSFQDRQLDVYIVPTNVPSPVITQVALSNQIRMLGIPEDRLESPEVKQLIARPGFSFDEIAPDAYGENQMNTDKVITLGVTVGIGTHKDLPEETIYQMMKAFWEGLVEVQEETPWMRRIDTAGAFKDLNMPLHSGAVRYFKEIGLDVPAEFIVD